MLHARREVGLEVYPEKTKYMFVSCQQNAGQNHNLLIANTFFENVAKFKYCRTAVANQKCIHEEIKGILNLVDACYHSVQSLLSSHLLSKNSLHNEELHSMYTSSNIIRVIKSRNMRWVVHVAHMGD
jgi:hypothetical protein